MENSITQEQEVKPLVKQTKAPVSVVDPISGTTSSAFLFPEEVLESQQRLQSRRRALLDIRRVNNPEEDVQSLYERTTKDVSDGLTDEYMNQELAMFAANQQQELTEGLFSSLDGTEQTAKMVADNVQYLQDVQDTYLDFDGYWKATADAKVPIGVDELKAQRQLVRGYAHSRLEEVAEDKGLLGDAIDYTTSFFQVDSLKDISDIFEDGPIDSVEKLRDWQKMFQSRTPDEQMILMEQAVPELLEAYDNNTVKTAAMLELLLSPEDIGPSIAAGALFDAFVITDAVVLYKLAKGAIAARSLAQRAVDSESIDEAAKLEVVAGADTKAVKDAVGVSKVDSAHSANPSPTKIIDEGSSIDNLAGEMDIVLKRQDKIVPTEYLPTNISHLPPATFKSVKRESDLLAQQIKEQEAAVAQLRAELEIEKATKLSRGDEKILRKDIEKLRTSLAEKEAEIRKIEKDLASGTKATREARTAEISSLRRAAEPLRRDLAEAEEFLKLSTKGAKAEANISRLDGLHLSKLDPKVKARYEEIKTKLAKESSSAKTEANYAKGLAGKPDESIAPFIREAIEKEKVKLREPSQPKTQEAGFTAVIPKQQVIQDEIKALKDSIIRPEAFSPEEEALATKRVLEKVQEEVAEAGLELNGKPVIARDAEGYTVKYNTTSGEGEHTFRFTKDDIGSSVSANDARDFKVRWTAYFDKVFTPETLLQDLSPKLVSDLTFGEQQAARLKNELSRIWKESEQGLTKKENFEVNALLQAGDEEVVEQFPIADLRAGGIETGAGKIKYTDGQIESYLQKRTLFRELHKIRDTMIKEQLEFEGFENLKYVEDGVSKDLIGRKLKTFSTQDIGKNDLVYLPGQEKRKRFTSGAGLETHKQMYKDNDYAVVELLEPFTTKDGKLVKFALSPNTDKWSRLPNHVLNYQAGYVPRIYKAGYWYVRDMDDPSKAVLYAFPSKEKAQKWVDQYIQETGKAASVFKDQEFGKLERLVEDANAYGGLYTGARKKRALMVKDGDNEFRPERMSVAQATERYINNISNIMPMNEYRMAVMERWKNDVKLFADTYGRTGLGKDQHFNVNPERVDLPEDIKKLMMMQRDYIKETLSVGGRQEAKMEGLLLGAANIMEGKAWLAKPRQFLLDNSQGNPSAWLKGHSFNLMMGWFNVRQLFVQSQNAVLTMSIDPKNGLLGAADAFKLRTIALLDEDRAIQAAKAMDLEPDIVQSLVQYNKSGLRDGIVKQADFNVHELGIAPSSLDVVRKASKGGRIFFNEGENFSRLISWSTARRRWKEANPSKAIDDAAIRDISQDALRMQMNMQNANAAWWQKAPVLDLMTQFLQVQAKFLEGVMPKILGGSGKWTGREKAQVLAGQILLYGTVGVPVAEEAIAYIAELTGQDPITYAKENPQVVDAINEGFSGYVAGLFGADKLAPSESFSLLAGMDDNVIYDVIKGANQIFNGGYEEGGFIETLSGPSASTIKRGGDVYSGLVLTARAIVEKPSLDVAYGALIENLDNIASMTSTWNNAKKAYYLNTMDKLFSSSGKLVATSEDLGRLSLTEQLGIAMGIQTDVEAYHYKNKDALKKSKQLRREKKNDLKEALIEYEKSGNESLWKAKKALLLNDLNTMEAIQIMDEVMNESISGDSDVNRSTNQAIQNLMRNGGSPTTAQSLLLSREKE